METNSTNKSEKTSERIKFIETDLKHHRRSIKRLKAYAEGLRQIDRAPFAPRIIKYSCIPRSAKRCEWTLKNITTQVDLLETELETLNKYGE